MARPLRIEYHGAFYHVTSRVNERKAVKEVLGDVDPLRKKVVIFFCQRHGGIKLKQVGERFGTGDAAVSVICKRLLGQTAKDWKVKEVLEQVGNLLNVEL